MKVPEGRMRWKPRRFTALYVIRRVDLGIDPYGFVSICVLGQCHYASTRAVMTLEKHHMLGSYCPDSKKRRASPVK